MSIDDKDIELLQTLINNHYRYTQSSKAKEILDNFDSILITFWKVVPKEVEEIEKKSRDEKVGLSVSR